MICVFIYEGDMCICVFMYEGQRSTSRCRSQKLSSCFLLLVLFFEAEFLTGLGIAMYARNLPVSISLTLEASDTMTSFLCGHWGLNLFPYVSTASTLPGEPSPQLLYIYDLSVCK